MGMLRPVISSWLIWSKCLTRARRELPWAEIKTFLPDLMVGAMVSFQYGRTLSTVFFRHSFRGKSSSGTEAN